MERGREQRRRAWCVAALALAGLAAAQPAPPPSARLRGVVRDLSGRPWAGAHVVAVSTLAGEAWFAPDQDRAEVLSDERGRFEVQVLPDRAYFVWAWQDVDGFEYRVSRVAGNRTAGTLVTLMESRHTQVRVPVRIEGIDAWRPHGGVRAFVRSELLGDAPGSRLRLRADLVLGEDGRSRVPPWPWPSAALVVLSSAGKLLHEKSLDLTLRNLLNLEDAGQRGERAAIAEAQSSFALKAPRPLRLELVAKDGPLAGARIALRWNDAWLPWGTTDAAGVAHLVSGELAGANQAEHVHVSRGGIGMSVQDPRFAAVGAGGLVGRLEVDLDPALSGRVLLALGEPARRLPMLLYAQVGAKLAADFAPLLVTTDDEGRFRLDLVRPRAWFSLRALLGRSHAPALAAARDAHLAATALLCEGQMTAEDLDLGDLRLDRLVRLDVQVVDAGRRPEHPTIVAWPVRAGNARPFEAFRVAGDRSGKVRLLVPPSVGLVLSAGWEGGFAEIEWQGARAEAGAATVELPGEEGCTVFGRVVCAGQPVVDAEVEVRAGTGPRHAGFLANQRVFSGADGRFELRLPIGVQRWTLVARAYKRGQPLAQSGGAFQLTPPARDEVVLELLDGQ